MGCGISKPSQFEGDTNIDSNSKIKKPTVVPKLKLDITKLKKQETQLRNKIEIATFSDEEDLVSTRNKDTSNYNSVTERLKEN